MNLTPTFSAAGADAGRRADSQPGSVRCRGPTCGARAALRQAHDLGIRSRGKCDPGRDRGEVQVAPVERENRAPG